MPTGCDVRHNPTPEEIAQACAEIREGWDERRWHGQSIEAERGWSLYLASDPDLGE